MTFGGAPALGSLRSTALLEAAEPGRGRFDFRCQLPGSEKRSVRFEGRMIAFDPEWAYLRLMIAQQELTGESSASLDPPRLNPSRPAWLRLFTRGTDIDDLIAEIHWTWINGERGGEALMSSITPFRCYPQPGIH